MPEWVIDTEISDPAFRVYCLLLRYGNTSGQRMPSRRLLAVRLHRSVDAVDRAVRELVDAGLVRIEHRRAGRRNLTNRYHLTTRQPGPTTTPDGGGRTSAPTPANEPQASEPVEQGEGRNDAGSRTSAGSRTCAATPGPRSGRECAGRVAADLRPDPENKTHTPPPPTPSTPAPGGSSGWREEEVLERCGLADLDHLVDRCLAARRALGKPTGRWSRHTLLAATQLALSRGWPGSLVEPALLTVATDPQTRSPMRLAEAGPWWDIQAPQPAENPAEFDGVDLAALAAELDDVAGLRPALQAQARAELTAEHLPLTRTTVTVRAVQILHRSTRGDAA